MTIKKLIKQLHNFNPKANINVIVHNKKEEFSICWGINDGEGITKENATTVSFYVDRLCQNENSI